MRTNHCILSHCGGGSRSCRTISEHSGCGVWRVACGVSCKVGGWVLKIVSIELVKGFYEVIKHPHPDPTILAGRI